MSDLLETIAAMRHQEDHGYTVRDCITHASDPSIRVEVDMECRSKMSDWCLQVVDFCKFSHESVEISMNYLDRFLETHAGAAALADRNEYQLASMTSLYTAIKIHERQAMNPAVISTLSRGVYSETDVEEMESKILNALQWRMHPPTSLSFLRQFLSIIPEAQLNRKERQIVFELSSIQSKLAVQEYKFIAQKASTIAYCAMMNSLESIQSIDQKTLNNISHLLASSISLDKCSDNVLDTASSLYAAVVDSPLPHKLRDVGIQPMHAAQNVNHRDSFEDSPRTISANFISY